MCRLSLDIGCGMSVLARRLAERSEKVIGIGVGPEILSHAGSFPNSESA